MAEQTTSSITIQAPPATVMSVLADLPAYPQWADGVREVEVLDRDEAGRPRRVRFRLDSGPIKDSYVLSYTWEGERSVRWSLAERGAILKALDGSYTLRAADDRAGPTEVTYRLTVDVSLPMIGMLKRKAEKVIVDTALRGLQRRVEG